MLTFPGRTLTWVVALHAAAAKCDARAAFAMTLLHKAANNNKLAALRALLDAGADIEAVDAFGFTALHKAALRGHAQVVQILLEAGARSDAKDSWGNTPGIYALRGDFAEYFALEFLNNRKVRPSCSLAQISCVFCK